MILYELLSGRLRGREDSVIQNIDKEGTRRFDSFGGVLLWIYLKMYFVLLVIVWNVTKQSVPRT